MVIGILKVKTKNPTATHPTKSGAGFTLIELLVVIAIIGLLASVVLIALNGARSKARDTKRIADFKQISTAMELFYDSQGRYPLSIGTPTWDEQWNGLRSCLTKGTNCGFTVSNFTPVMNALPNDPLYVSTGGYNDQHPYYFGYPGCNDGYRLAVNLENIPSASQSGLTGSFYNNNNFCNPATKGYCVGSGTCPGF